MTLLRLFSLQGQSMTLPNNKKLGHIRTTQNGIGKNTA